jgi:uncharacterized protein (TIGR00255 family)
MSHVSSMTGFARTASADSGAAWVWELRSVNGRGLEFRFKLTGGLDWLEPRLRSLAAARLARGTVQASLSLKSEDLAAMTVDRTLLSRLAAEARALAELFPGTPAPRAELLLGLPGVVRREVSEDAPAVTDERAERIAADFALAIDYLAAARLAEGGRLAVILRDLFDQLAVLRGLAAEAAADQPRAQQARMAQALDKLLQGSAPVPVERLAQEIALLAVRADVTEEIDRLGSHLEAAAKLLAQAGPSGRQLDFLVQEFLRETNTLCSKSQSAPLTNIGLQMKGVIEQIREQVQNIE